MSIRLGDYVVYGELRNSQNYTTFGYLVLRPPSGATATVLGFELTGNPEPDLQGKTIRFWPAEGAPSLDFHLDQYLDVKLGQVGATGEMTAEGWVRALPCPVDEFLHRSRLGEAPPTQWTRRLYLEWFGQNGRMVVEMAGAVVEQQIRAPESPDEEGEWAPLPNLALPPDFGTMQPPVGPQITAIERVDGEYIVEDWTPDPESGMPGDLQWELDREAAAVDRAIRGGDDDVFGDEYDDPTGELELMDRCLERGEGTPVGSLLPDVGQLPQPHELDDEQVEFQLKVLLGQLALIGVALDVCRHFTPRDCYTLLLEKILPKYTTYKELIGTGWVQHYSTWEDCEDCAAEMEAEFESKGGE